MRPASPVESNFADPQSRSRDRWTAQLIRTAELAHVADRLAIGATSNAAWSWSARERMFDGIVEVMARKPSSRHVVPSKDGGWKVVKPGGRRAVRAPTQKEAERRAKEIVANEGGGEVRIHRPDGRIRDSDTVAPGNDPHPPRDKRH